MLLVGAALLGRMKLNAVTAKAGPEQYIPDAHLSIRNVWELVVGGLYDLFHDVLGDNANKGIYFGLLGGMFIFILISNLMGLVPGFAAPTGDFNLNLAMSLVVLVVFNVAGLWVNGFGYIKHMMGPVWWLMPLIFTVELLGVLVVRPVSLTLRLTGNMFGDHLVFGIMSDLTYLVFPVAFLALGAFVCCIQALVFTLLSAVYVALATAHDESHH